MDPLAQINVHHDSTFALMRENTRRGYTTWWCTPQRLFAKCGRGWVHAERVSTHDVAPHFRSQSIVEMCSLDDFDVVWMRKDPPVDLAYLFTNYLLEMASPRTLVINNPASMVRFNDKIAAMRFTDYHPPTLMTCDRDQLRAFVEAQPGKTVLKPWYGCGGHGIMVTHGADRNLGSMLDLLTAMGREYIIAQPFLPAAAQGDKRVLLFDGEPIGAVLRVPTERDYRGNMHVGAQVQRCVLTERDKEICRVVAPTLREAGMVFVGLDIIGDYLTEINGSSPTGIQEVNRLYGVRTEGTLLDRLEERVNASSERTVA